MEGARIGKLYDFPGAVISAIPQDLKYNGEETTAEMEIIQQSESVLLSIVEQRKNKNCDW